MSIIHFILDVYFAAVLGVAGLAKLDRSRFFHSTLHYRYHLPDWSAKIIGRTFPYVEIFLSITLLIATNTLKSVVTIAILALFSIFFVMHTREHISRKASDDCGCYGKALRRSGIQTNIITLFIQLSLAACLVFLTLFFAPLAYSYYLVGTVLFIGLYSLLGWNLWKRHHFAKRARLLTGLSG